MPTDLQVHFWSGANGGGGGGGSGSLPSTIRANSVALASAATSGSVVFGVAFAAQPVLVTSITSSNGAADFITAQATTPTTTGFSYTLSTQTPDTTYTLNWVASVINA